MSYIKTTWVTGDIVTAPRMNNIENGIYNNDAAISALQRDVSETETDVTTLQGNVSALQTNVIALQTTTENLIPSIAEVFSTSSTYAVGDHVMYNGRLYECKTAVTTAGAWNASNWDAVSVYKYDDLVGVIKITSTSTTMATIETTLATVNAAGDHVVFDVSALSAGMKLCAIYLNDGQYRITDIATGFDGEGTYSSTDTLASILAKGSEPFYITNTTPYLFRQTPYSSIGNKEILEKLVGGSLGWNQIVKNGNFSNGTNDWTLGLLTATVSSNVITLTATGTQTAANINQTLSVPSGHKCFVSLSVNPSANNKIKYQLYDGSSFTGTTDITASASTWTAHQNIINCTLNAIQLYIRPNQNGASGYSCQMKEVQIIDLTQMFGSTIADYIYNLEAATTGSGVAWLKKYIDLSSYHAYDAGSIQSVQATAHVTTGFNQWDGVYEAGTYNQNTGEKSSSQASLTNRSANKVRILPNTTYYHVGGGMRVFFYDGNEVYISNMAASSTAGAFTPPANARYLTFQISNTLDMEAICINISKTTGSPKNGDYVPYNGLIYPLGTDTLRGIPQLVNNELNYDGDVMTPDGTIKRKYGIVDLGTLTWNIGGTGTYRRYYTTETNLAKVPSTQDDDVNIICDSYVASAFNTLLTTDKRISINITGAINISDSAYASSTAAQFKTAMSGVYLVYELATPTTENGTAYQRIQTVDADGTEQFVTSTPVLVCSVAKYPQNTLALLSEISDPVSSVPIPNAPSTNGTYTLKVVVSNGTPTYTWVTG